MSKSNFNFWKKIWDSKGDSESFDLLFLDGYEHLSSQFDSSIICNKIISALDIPQGSRVLEVATGCGFLAREFSSDYEFVGIDYSEPIVRKHRELFNHEVHVCESNKIIFKDDSFDYVFCYGLFQYLPDLTYANDTIEEMCRVSKNGVFIGDLKNKKTRDTHFVFPKEDLEKLGFTILIPEEDVDNSERYSAFRRFK